MRKEEGAGAAAVELRRMLHRALTVTPVRLTLGMLRREVPSLLRPACAGRIEAAIDAVEHWTSDAVLDAVCGVDVDEDDIARVRAYLDGLAPYFTGEVAQPPRPDPDTEAAWARAAAESLANPASRNAMEAAGLKPPAMLTEAEIVAEEERARSWALDRQLRAHGDGRRFKAAGKAHLMQGELRRYEAAIRDLRVSDEKVEAAIATIERAYLAWNGKSPTERGADLETAMLLAKAVEIGASTYAELKSLSIAAEQALIEFRNRAPDAAARLGWPYPAAYVDDDPPPSLVEAVGELINAWQGRGGRRRKAAAKAGGRRAGPGERRPLQWDAIADFLSRSLGYAPTSRSLANEWSRRWHGGARTGKRRPLK